LPPLIEGGVHISLRVNQQRAVVDHDQNIERLFELIITQRKNFLISGGTGSGKTTLLSHLIENFPEGERLLVIEDTHEIKANHLHLLRLQARPQNSEGLGEVTVRELIRHALRMKPDRIILGEIRGADVLDLFLALNTGHAGSGATIHANSPRDIPNRIAALAMMSGIPREGALALYSSAIDFIIHLDNRLSGNRIAAIVEIDK
jgi:pilus assembly protein CpaF